MKVVHCREVGFDCPGVVRAETTEEVLQQVAHHARTTHGIEVTEDVVQRVLSVMRDEGE